ncbi:MAG: BREX system P-loop protein BrxC [Thermoleophilia bacterium]|nr:BREX system P-loop protein BrxC [Thermoleophilia bacterium]
MTLNRDVLVRDPTANPLPNDGVAKVGRPRTEEEWRVLAWELESFVCTGEYGRGLERILSTYLGNLDRDTQPAAWVSGFYGSGKSHFVRVLEQLWLDETLPSGSTARGLVRLPDTIKASLKELSTAGNREGGLWAASGKLASGTAGSFRLAFLGILLAAADLPTDYAPARLVLRLMQEEAYDAFKASIARQGKELESELRNMYVSPYVGAALLEAIPGFAKDEEQARRLLLEQYPHAADISEDELLATVADILATRSSKPGKLPCTLVVLDELQQFIHEDPRVILTVQDIVEACSSRFGSSILFVATGQAALQADSILARFQDRFTVRVHLTDTDIEKVVRSVVLQKRQDREPELRDVLESVSGEIDRHLPGTTIAPSGADAEDLAPDYPVLPSRRRFWELVLKAVDEGGGGLLRSQLRTTHEAAAHVADEPLGHVIGGDFIFEDQEAAMLQTGVLLREVDQDIRQLDDGTDEGRLLSRLCATIFLISRLPRETGADAGIRATSETLADLVVTDLPSGSADLRRRVPELLEGLVEQGKIQKVEEEYRLQTREGQEWEGDFRRRETALRGAPERTAGIRGDLLRAAIDRATGSLTVHQGVSKEARGLSLHFGESTPAVEDKIPVWVRDGWTVAEGAVRAEAAAAGAESAIIHVYLPRRSAEDLTRAIATYTAAGEVLDSRAANTDEAREAQLAMRHRRDSAEVRLQGLVDEIVDGAIVLKGGGTQVTGASLKDALLQAGQDAAVRLFPRFADADHPGWGTVVKRAGDGNPAALEAVRFTGDAKTHPVCKAILEFVGAGKKGSEIRSRFVSAPYGWPKDAVDGALLTLLAGDAVEARTDGVPVTAKQLTLTKLGVSAFRATGPVPTVDERTAFRAICQLVGLDCKSGEEAAKSSELLRVLIELARSAGGPAPLPEPPATADLEEQQANSENERVIEIAAMTELKSDVKQWKKLRDEAEARVRSWNLVQRLAAHSEGIASASDIVEQLRAIEEQRTLLSEPDPLAPVRQSLTGALRDALVAARNEVAAARASARAELEGAQGWSKLEKAQREQILEHNDLLDPPELSIGTDEELLDSLDRMGLGAWAGKVREVPTALEEAMLAVARELEPTARPVQLPRATLKEPDDVEKYVDGVRAQLESEIKDGPIVVS